MIYTLKEAIKNGLKPGNTIRVYIESSGTELLGIYNNPIPTLDIGNETKFPLSYDDLITEIDGKRI